MPSKPKVTGGLRKILNVKGGARIMVTTNIDVSDKTNKWCNRDNM